MCSLSDVLKGKHFGLHHKQTKHNLEHQLERFVNSFEFISSTPSVLMESIELFGIERKNLKCDWTSLWSVTFKRANRIWHKVEY